MHWHINSANGLRLIHFLFSNKEAGNKNLYHKAATNTHNEMQQSMVAKMNCLNATNN